MVKGTLGFGVAWLIQLCGFTCGAFLICADTTLLQSVVETVGNIVYLSLSLISAVLFLWGLARAVWLNRISAYPLPPAELPR